jgi:hypothetical protein
MKKGQIDACYVVKPFAQHDKYKEDILDYIAHDLAFDFKNATSNIKTDWGKLTQRKRQYWSIIENDILDHMVEVYKELGYGEAKVYNSWFQQYYQTGKHGWHTHLNCQWTNVYYVEFPEGAPPTEMINPFTNQSIFVDVKEGDLLTFPSLILHRAPEVMTDIRKTIISFNSDSAY